MSRISRHGFISHKAIIHHDNLRLGDNVLIEDDCVLFQGEQGEPGGPISLHNNVCIFRSTILETGHGGSISILAGASIHPKCQINANLANIVIEEGVMIAPACALYSYDHSTEAGIPIGEQPLKSKGDIVIRKNAWLGYGVIVTSGVEIGEGAVVGAGSVVSKDIPANSIAVGNPAKVVTVR